jgi:hypothetical protein
VPDSQLLLHTGNWSRGLAVGKSTLWVGSSEQANRRNRHKESIDGEVRIYGLKPPYKLLKTLKLEAAGQVNDILVLTDNNRD